MKKTNDQGEIVTFIMEPEEELTALRFIEFHKPSPIISAYVLWAPDLEDSEIITAIGLRGGYGVHFHGLLHQGDFA